MRHLLMAGTALMLMGGVALAQTQVGGQSPAAAQSNTGVTGQTSGNVRGASGGSMGAGSMTSQQTGGSQMGSSGDSTTAMQPAMPSGNHTMPTQRRSTMSKESSGNGTMNNTSMASGSMNNPAYISHRMGRGVPSGESAGAYLHMAQHAVMKHNKMMARDALGRAETDLLTNSYVQGSVSGPISTPAISDIRSARQAVTGGDYHNASMMIHKAMMDMHGGGMMHHSGMGSSGAMGNTGMMNHGGMNNGSMGNSSMGNGSMGNGSAMSGGGMSHSAVSGSMSSGSMQGKQDSTMNKSMSNSTTSPQ